MFHAVNGDRAGNGRLMAGGLLPIDVEPTIANKGDRGYSDQAEATIFMIGTPARERPRR
jgi:hypothetical protein